MKTDRAEALVKRFHTHDPIVIARCLGIPIHYLYHPESKVPGLTCLVQNRPSIFVNDAYFERQLQNNHGYTEEHARRDKVLVIGHELGHSVKHRNALKAAPIKEYQLLSVHSVLEREANDFAAQLLIDRREMLELLKSGMDVLDVAAKLQVNVNLLLYRIEMLQREGYPIREIPYIPKNNFIGHISGSASEEWM